MSNSVFEILLLLVSLTVQASEAAPGVARPYCAETCGNVTFPFPFGIGAGCFMDEWYEIDCQQSNTVPILKKIGLPVLNISLPDYDRSMNGMISVSLPLIYSNVSCGGDGYGMPVSLEGSKFVFSQSWNIFTSVGYDTKAAVTSNESAGIAFRSTGCRSKCAGTNANNSWYSACFNETTFALMKLILLSLKRC